MDRLTTRTELGSLIQKMHTSTRQLIDRLGEYEDAEEQGLLLRLPCKVGDTIYYIDDYYIYSDKVNGIEIRKENGNYIFCIAYMDYKAEDFGKTVFLTYKEAEKELANRLQSHAEAIMDERNGR